MSCAHTAKNQQKKWEKNYFLSIWLHKEKGFLILLSLHVVTYWNLCFCDAVWCMLLRLATVSVEMIESSHAFMSCWSIVSLTHFLTDYSLAFSWASNIFLSTQSDGAFFVIYNIADFCRSSLFALALKLNIISTKLLIFLFNLVLWHHVTVKYYYYYYLLPHGKKKV